MQVTGQCSTICGPQTLLIWGDTLLVLDLGLTVQATENCSPESATQHLKTVHHQNDAVLSPSCIGNISAMPELLQLYDDRTVLQTLTQMDPALTLSMVSDA